MNLNGLTPREQQVARHIMVGRMDKVTAAELKISPRTVQDFRRRIFAKFGCRNAVELVRVVHNITEV